MKIGPQSERIPAFEARLKMLMQAGGWTGVSLARAMDLDQSTISVWRRGLSRPSLSRLMQLARVLDVDPNYLLGWSNKRPDLQIAKSELSAVKRRRRAVAP